MHKRRPSQDRRRQFVKSIELLLSWRNHGWRTGRNFILIEHRVCSYMCWHGRQHLLLAIDQIAGIKRGNLEAMSERDCIRGTRLDTISAKNAAVIVNVVNLGVALCAAHPVLSRVLRRLDINAIRRASCRAKKTSHALLQSIFVALQDVNAAISFLKFCSLQRPGPVRVILHHRWSKHLPESDAHALSNSSDVFQDRHTLISIAKPYKAAQFRPLTGHLPMPNGCG